MSKNKSGDDNNAWEKMFQEKLIKYLPQTNYVFYNFFILYVAQLTGISIPDSLQNYHLATLVNTTIMWHFCSG